MKGSRMFLKVPYYTQKNGYTCQSACLKMMAEYFDGRLNLKLPRRQIQDIYNQMKEDYSSPEAWQSFINWLKEHYGDHIEFSMTTTSDQKLAIENIRNALMLGFPVLCSTNHANSGGHIILVVGMVQDNITSSLPTKEPTQPSFYKISNSFPTKDPIQPKYWFICHDPYGTFNPIISDNRFGEKRFDGGSCLLSGGENAPGKAVRYDLQGIKRAREDRHSSNVFLLIRGVGWKTGMCSR